MPFKNIQWVVQQMLTDSNDIEQIRLACRQINVDFVEVQIIPFTDELPGFDRQKDTIFYGSTNLMNVIYRHDELKSGLFYDAATFTIENYLQHWTHHMLNYGASVVTFRELVTMPFTDEQLLFIRPNEDSKAFAGETRSFGDIKRWYEKIERVEAVGLLPETMVVVGEPFNIKKEWRLWIVDKKVVSASQYRGYFKLKKLQGCPPEVIAFAEQRCQEYTPHDVFVMDVGLCGDAYYIIECNCMNSAGFYKADISAIVKAVTEYFAKK